MALTSKTKQATVSQADKDRLMKMLNQSQRKAVELAQAKQQHSAKQPKNWQTLSQEDQQALTLKALEMVIHGKELTPAVKQTLPPKMVQELLNLMQGLDKHRLLATRSIPKRLEFIVERLHKRGILTKPTKDNPLDRLSPQQRKRQLAAEALELRRQNAIQMVEANKLLPKQPTA